MTPTAAPVAPGAPGANPKANPRRQGASLVPGIAVVAALASVATVLGRIVPVVGAPVFAVFGGVGIALYRPPTPRQRPGVGFASKTLLKASVVLLGSGLSLQQVVTIGGASLPVLVGTLAVALVGAALIGRALGVARDLRTLIGVGTGICGASAIAATDTVIGAASADVSYAIATIFSFNVAAVVTFPTIGHALGLTPHAFGLWSGTAINDLSSVVAAAAIFGHGASGYAVVVKLTRALMIVPVTIGLSAWRSRRSRQGQPDAAREARGLRHVVPMSTAWFVVAVALNSAGLIPGSWHRSLYVAAEGMITMALGAIGLSTQPRNILRTGLRPLTLGAALWILVTATSLGLQVAVGGPG